MIDRRTFVKLGMHLLGLIAAFRHRWPAAATPHRSFYDSTPYGSGPYGEGLYEGCCHLYIPLVQREDG